eukprot:883188-Prymnesium_polylepis.1
MVGREGFDETHYGRNIVSRPLIHPSESPLEWEDYNDALCTDKEGVFKPMRPARSMCVNVPSTFMSKGAANVSDFITPKDEAARRRVEGSAKLLGLFTAAASKGYANGNHAQLEPFMGYEPMEFYKKKNAMEPFNSYVYTLVDENDPDANGYRAQMFMYACEAVYDPEGEHIICFRHWKLVFDHAHSDSYAWKKIMEENFIRANRSSRSKRSTMTQEERICMDVTNVSDLHVLYRAYAGTTGDSLGAPVFDETALPAGLATHELYADKDELLGGLHPFGPEAALNARRFPSEGGCCPLTAGMVDIHGNLLIGHEEQMHPSKYFNENGDFVLPSFVQEKSAFKIMANPYKTSIFDAELPHFVSNESETEQTGYGQPSTSGDFALLRRALKWLPSPGKQSQVARVLDRLESASLPEHLLSAEDIGRYFVLTPELGRLLMLQTPKEWADFDICVRLDAISDVLPEGTVMDSQELPTAFQRDHGHGDFPDRAFIPPFFKFTMGYNPWLNEKLVGASDADPVRLLDKPCLILEHWHLHLIEPVGEGRFYERVQHFPRCTGAVIPRFEASFNRTKWTPDQIARDEAEYDTVTEMLLDLPKGHPFRIP